MSELEEWSINGDSMFEQATIGISTKADKNQRNLAADRGNIDDIKSPQMPKKKKSVLQLPPIQNSYNLNHRLASIKTVAASANDKKHTGKLEKLNNEFYFLEANHIISKSNKSNNTKALNQQRGIDFYDFETPDRSQKVVKNIKEDSSQRDKPKNKSYLSENSEGINGEDDDEESQRGQQQIQNKQQKQSSDFEYNNQFQNSSDYEGEEVGDDYERDLFLNNEEEEDDYNFDEDEKQYHESNFGYQSECLQSLDMITHIPKDYNQIEKIPEEENTQTLLTNKTSNVQKSPTNSNSHLHKSENQQNNKNFRVNQQQQNQSPKGQKQQINYTKVDAHKRLQSEPSHSIQLKQIYRNSPNNSPLNNRGRRPTHFDDYSSNNNNQKSNNYSASSSSIGKKKKNKSKENLLKKLKVNSNNCIKKQRTRKSDFTINQYINVSISPTQKENASNKSKRKFTSYLSSALPSTQRSANSQNFGKVLQSYQESNFKSRGNSKDNLIQISHSPSASLVSQLNNLLIEKDYVQMDNEQILEEQQELIEKVEALKKQNNILSQQDEINNSISQFDSRQRSKLPSPIHYRQDLEIMSNKQIIQQLRGIYNKYKDRANTISDPGYMTSLKQQVIAASKVMQKLKKEVKGEEQKKKVIEKQRMEFKKNYGICQEEIEVRDLMIKIEEFERKNHFLEESYNKNLASVSKASNELQLKQERLNELIQKANTNKVNADGSSSKSNLLLFHTGNKKHKLVLINQKLNVLQKSCNSTSKCYSIREDFLKKELKEYKNILQELLDKEWGLDSSIKTVIKRIEYEKESAGIDEIILRDEDGINGADFISLSPSQIKRQQIVDEQSQGYDSNSENFDEEDDLKETNIQQEQESKLKQEVTISQNYKEESVQSQKSSSATEKTFITENQGQEELAITQKSYSIQSRERINKDKFEKSEQFAEVKKRDNQFQINQQPEISKDVVQPIQKTPNESIILSKPNFNLKKAPTPIEKKSEVENSSSTDVKIIEKSSSSPEKELKKQDIFIPISQAQHNESDNALLLKQESSSPKIENSKQLFNFSKRNRLSNSLQPPLRQEEKINDPNSAFIESQNKLNSNSTNSKSNLQQDNQNQIPSKPIQKEIDNEYTFLGPRERISRKRNASKKENNEVNKSYEPSSFEVKEITDKNDENNNQIKDQTQFKEIGRQDKLIHDDSPQNNELSFLLDKKKNENNYQDDDNIFGEAFQGSSKRLKSTKKTEKQKSHDLVILAGKRNLLDELDLS